MPVRESWRKAPVTFGIAAVTAAAWILLEATGAQHIIGARWGGFMSLRFTLGVGATDGLWLLLEPLTLALVNLSFIALAVNLLFLIVLGRIVETIVGGRGLLILYVVSAYAGMAAHYLSGPQDVTLLLGSGAALSGVVGAYAMLAGRLRAKASRPAVGRAINVLWIGAAWAGFQLLLALAGPRVLEVPQLAPVPLAWGFVACAGGFLAGLLLARPLLMLRWRGA